MPFVKKRHTLSEGMRSTPVVNIVKGKVVLAASNEATWLDISPFGHGSFGTVFSGMLDNECVAFKVSNLKSIDASHTIIRERYLFQYKKLIHPTIVEYIEGCDAWCEERQQTCPGYIMKLYPTDLYKQMKDTNVFPVWRIERVLDDTLAALHFLESKSIVHRDLKPENLMWDGSHYRLGDFNCAVIKADMSIGKHVQALVYRAPENLLRCDTGLTHQSRMDEWALGCILVELLVNEPLFSEATERNMVHAIVATLGPLPSFMLDTSRNGTVVDTKTNMLLPPDGHIESPCKALLQKAVTKVHDSANTELGERVIDVISKTLIADPKKRKGSGEFIL